jgi:hypothetical protein
LVDPGDTVFCKTCELANAVEIIDQISPVNVFRNGGGESFGSGEPADHAGSDAERKWWAVVRIWPCRVVEALSL